MARKRTPSSKKATLIAFGLVALAASVSASTTAPTIPTQDASLAHEQSQPNSQADTAAEAARAYKQAVVTLNALINAPTAPRPNDRLVSPSHGPSLLSYILPNAQGQGPVASAIRIAMKLRHQSWIPRSLKNMFTAELGGKKKEDEMTGRAVKVIDLLQHAAELGNADALYTLAQISLTPPTPYFPSNPALSYASFSHHARETANASSQAAMGFFYATGYGGVVPVDQARAQLYLTFAAHGGHKGAQMALGYRYWSGIGVAENCMTALTWYEEAAEQAMAKFLSGPPGGRTMPMSPARLSDLEGGVYGPGASVASTGMNAGRPVIKTMTSRAAGETWDDLLEYYLFNADRGEEDFAYRLGKIFYQGSIYSNPGGIASGGDGAASIARDFHRARHYFLRIARQIWPSDPADPRKNRRATKEDSPRQAGFAPYAAGYLGRMFLRGEGVKQDAAMARMWFERGADYGDKECYNGLGIIWRDGLVDGKKDTKKAAGYFMSAASQELADAHVQLGKLYYDSGDTKTATVYFEQGIRQGNPFEGYYYLADLQARIARQAGTPREIVGSTCAVAVSFYKLVTERGTWGEDLIVDADAQWHSGTDRGKEMAMLRWWIAAERGYEVAQNNLAFVLDQDRSILRATRFAPISPSNDTARLALTQWTRSAAQRNVDALVKVGDYYYYGLGVPDEHETSRYEKAAGYYQSAADTQMSALAMWNLGWMYENGKGVPMDFHLAKRHYDLALETNSEAYMPVTLALIKLHIKMEEDESYFAERGGQDVQHDGEGGEAHGSDGEVQDDSPWYLGKARDEFNRRQQREEVDGSEDDPVQWARDRRAAENERDGDFGPEDYFDGATRGGHRGDEDVDEFLETMLLVLLCIMVSTLLFIRGRWVERLRRADDQQQGDQQAQNGQPPAQPAGGLYPPPGAQAARNNWNILR
ncbi:ERAD-associated protein [Steccherinum ochraceum]|uniref:ERAD-associated protein n=1 Tax=Steccherinum ochraceum TaxID=92696 RepID=A0A4R0R196_9APHY|nr:ERAD-associated protein [Steccherinum ochraceum]